MSFFTELNRFTFVTRRGGIYSFGVYPLTWRLHWNFEEGVIIYVGPFRLFCIPA